MGKRAQPIMKKNTKTAIKRKVQKHNTKPKGVKNG